MSKVLNESQIYPGWELPKHGIGREEKVLLIRSKKQNFKMTLAKAGAGLGLFTALYIVYNKYIETNENFALTQLLTLMAFYIFSFGIAGYLIGMAASRMRKK